MEAATTGNARGRASRARLLEAAAQCFAQRGYSATRISDIASTAGLSPAGFYRHFRDKDELLIEVLREPLELLLQATTPPARGDALSRDVLLERNVEFFRVYAANRGLFRVLRELAALREPGMEELWLDTRRTYVERIERWLRGLRRDGALQTRDVTILADALGGVLDQLAYTRLGLADHEPTAREIQKLGEVSADVWAGALGLPTSPRK